MQVNIYWNHTPVTPDENGIGWAESAGPVGSIAVGGGGYASIYRGGANGGASEVPFLPIIASKPYPDHPEGWLFGVLCPPWDEGMSPSVKVHCFVVCLEDMP